MRTFDLIAHFAFDEADAGLIRDLSNHGLDLKAPGLVGRAGGLDLARSDLSGLPAAVASLRPVGIPENLNPNKKCTESQPEQERTRNVPHLQSLINNENEMIP